MTEEYDPLTDDLIERLCTPKVTHHQCNDEGDPYETVARAHPVERIKIEAADALNAQAAEIAALRAENESNKSAYGQVTKACYDLTEKVIHNLRADAERLEWIESKLFGHKWNGVIDSGSRVNWSIAADFRHTTQRMVGNTFRDAIDAARGTTPAETLTEIDGCSEENCRRCRTAPNLRGNMAHAGIGSYPSARGTA